MTWLERLSENPDYLFEFFSDFFECYVPGLSLKEFYVCPDEFVIFDKLGLINNIGCSHNCLRCVFDFLTDPKIYEYSIEGEITDG